jgi:hypothetical protein
MRRPWRWSRWKVNALTGRRTFPNPTQVAKWVSTVPLTWGRGDDVGLAEETGGALQNLRSIMEGPTLSGGA